ncbi:MAG TPA: hypothetical protein VNQ73_04100 [Ilumatobacter sp.]|nr:hypothetical protein [Ilumatobacter sp.]
MSTTPLSMMWAALPAGESFANAPGSALLALDLQRKPEASSLLPTPVGDGRFGIWVGPAADRPASASTATWSTTDPAQVVGVVVRSHDWIAGPVLRVGAYRFRVAAELADEFERAAAAYLPEVQAEEPETLLYGFFRHDSTASGLLSAPARDCVDYLHLMAFTSDAAQDWHREVEFRDPTSSWGHTFPRLIRGPLESESFFADQIRAGRSVDALHHT